MEERERERGRGWVGGVYEREGENKREVVARSVVRGRERERERGRG